MPITHDGIAGRIPPNKLKVLVGLVLFLVPPFLDLPFPWWLPVPVVGLCLLANQFGSRRVRVIESKLLVEDTHLLTGNLIGPSRRRIEWGDVKGIRVEKGALHLDTGGAPFVTAQGAAPADLEHLRAKSEAAWKKAQASAG